jgi:hypothetical protein
MIVIRSQTVLFMKLTIPTGQICFCSLDAEERKQKEAEELSKETSNTNNNTTKPVAPSSGPTPAVSCSAGKGGN